MQTRSQTLLQQQQHVHEMSPEELNLAILFSNKMSQFYNNQDQLDYWDCVRLFHELFYLVYEYRKELKQSSRLSRVVHSICYKAEELVKTITEDIHSKKKIYFNTPTPDDLTNRMNLLQLLRTIKDECF